MTTTTLEDTDAPAKQQVVHIAEQKMLETLNWAYTSTLTGLPGQRTVYALVSDYLGKYDADAAERKLVQFQTTKAATAGFVTGLGGLITLPVAVPANVAAVILVQMRMIAAIALMHGYDLHEAKVKTFVYTTLTGSTAADLMKQSGLSFNAQLTANMIRKIPAAALTKINHRVSLRLVTKFGTTGAINLGQMVPIAGGLLGGSIDTATTVGIARLAHRTFTPSGVALTAAP